jgi:hypothetical protein
MDVFVSFVVFCRSLFDSRNEDCAARINDECILHTLSALNSGPLGTGIAFPGLAKKRARMCQIGLPIRAVANPAPPATFKPSLPGRVALRPSCSKAEMRAIHRSIKESRIALNGKRDSDT